MRIAFCKFAGLANGGTEKYLQTIAILYKKQFVNVDYYYTNAAPILHSQWIHPDNSIDRINLLKSHNVRLIPIHVKCRDNDNWTGSDFFEKFKESNYDILVTAGDGRAEFPYTKLNVPIIHTVHGTHVYNKPNIIKSVLLCHWQSTNWLANGGDKTKMEVIPPLVYIPSGWSNTFRRDHNIPPDAFVYGLHQANGVGSTMSLCAFSNIANAYYVILGGDSKHKQYCHNNSVKNVIFVDHTTSVDTIHNFLDAIDVYAHCREDGEVCSASIIEAMAHGKPVITYHGNGPNFGHIEQVQDCGIVARSADEYMSGMLQLRDKNYYYDMSEATKTKYNNVYDYKVVEKKLLQLVLYSN